MADARLLTGVSPSPLHALVLDSVNRMINVAFKLVPMRVGVDEVGTEAVAAAIGLAPGTGTLTALVRKIRMLIFAWRAGDVGGVWGQIDRGLQILNRTDASRI